MIKTEKQEGSKLPLFGVIYTKKVLTQNLHDQSQRSLSARNKIQVLIF